MAAADGPVRAFVAVELDVASRAAISELIARLRPRLPMVAWTRPENAHLTLKFLGNVSLEFIETYARDLEIAAATVPPVVARLTGLGAFPNLRRPSIIWTGMEFSGDSVARVQVEAEGAARRLGLVAETRAFMPHVTIGRVKRRRRTVDLRAGIQDESVLSIHEFTVDAVSLFSSELTTQGARHTRLHRFSFDGIRGQSGV